MPDATQDPNRDNAQQPTPDVTERVFRHFELPSRYRQNETVAVMVSADYSKEAKAALKVVQEKASEWLGEGIGDREDAGSLLSVSQTLFVTPSQRDELAAIVEGTPLELCSVEDIANAIQKGVSGDVLRKEGSREAPLTRLDHASNAGLAVAELTADRDLPWERQRELAFDVGNGLIQLQNCVSSIVQNVSYEIRRSLFQQFQVSAGLESRKDISQQQSSSIFRKANELTWDFTAESEHLREVQEAMLPLAKTLLGLPSPILKQIVYSMFDSDSNLLSRGLGLFDADQQAMLDALGDWKTFWETQIPLLTRYFEETAAEKMAARAVTETNPEEGKKRKSEWSCAYSSQAQGEKVALWPVKWDQTVFNDFNELPIKHWWGMKFLGVAGPIGEQVFDTLSELLDKSHAEALAARPAYANELFERQRQRRNLPDEASMDEQERESLERQLAFMRKQWSIEAEQLIHGVSDHIIRSLPWRLPDRHLLLETDPASHLERTVDLFEQALKLGEESRGLRVAAELSAEELAIQLNAWNYIEVLNTRPELANRCKTLFEKTQVHLPSDQGTRLREQGILPAASTTEEES